jgi:hypothetical protein
VALERKIHFLNAPSFGRFSEFRLGTPVPAAVHGNLRTIDHFFLLHFIKKVPNSGYLKANLAGFSI